MINTWEDSIYRPGFMANLDENGKLYCCNALGAASNSCIQNGGGGAIIERRN